MTDLADFTLANGLSATANNLFLPDESSEAAGRRGPHPRPPPRFQPCAPAGALPLIDIGAVNASDPFAACIIGHIEECPAPPPKKPDGGNSNSDGALVDPNQPDNRPPPPPPLPCVPKAVPIALGISGVSRDAIRDIMHSGPPPCPPPPHHGSPPPDDDPLAVCGEPPRPPRDKTVAAVLSHSPLAAVNNVSMAGLTRT